jgi:hypothetical protein
VTYRKHVAQDDGFSEPVFPTPVYRMACCDCGLVHTLRFSVAEITAVHPDGSFEISPKPAPERYRVMFQAARNNRSTAAIRREQRKREAKA